MPQLSTRMCARARTHTHTHTQCYWMSHWSACSATVRARHSTRDSSGLNRGSSPKLRGSRTLNSFKIRVCFHQWVLKGTTQICLFYFAADKSSGEVLVEGVGHLMDWEKCPFQANTRRNCTLGRENWHFSGLQPALTGIDNYHSNPGSLILHQARLSGDSGQLGLGGRKAEIIAGWGHGLCQVHTCVVTSSGRPLPVTAHSNYFSAHPGEGDKTSLSRFTEPFPQGWKMKCHKATSVLILRGHKIVRAIATRINKTWGVRRRKRKLWRCSKKNYSVIWVSSDGFLQGPQFFIF